MQEARSRQQALESRKWDLESLAACLLPPASRLLLIVLIFCLSSMIAAQEKPASPDAPPQEAQASTPAPKPASERLALTHHPKGEARARHATVEKPQTVLLKKEPFTYIHNIFRDALFQWRPPIGRSLDLQPEFIFSGQKAVRTADGSSGQVSFIYRLEGAWTTWGSEESGRGVLNFKLDGTRNLGAPRERNLSDNLGSAMEINGAWSSYTVALSSLWWQMESMGGRLRFDLGKIDLGDFFDENEVAGDEASQFLAGSLVHNPTIPFPDSGLGAHFQIQGKRYTLRAGVGDADSVTTRSPFRTARDGRIMGLVQLNLRPTLRISGRQRDGNYRFTLWGDNRKSAGGGGFAVSFDQELSETVEAFFRAGVASPQAVAAQAPPFRWFVSAGIGVTPPRRGDDQIGIGFGLGMSPLNRVATQTVVEAYWRIQVSHTMQLSPLLQFVTQPSTGSRPVIVPGLRLRIML